MALTELEIRNARPGEGPVRLRDEKGLYLDVRPTGKKVWRMRYKFRGKENTLTFGEYPLVGLKEARSKREDVRRLLMEDKDPALERDQKRADAPGKTFSDLALEWLQKKKLESQSEKYRYSLEMRLEKHILPFIGHFPPDDIGAPQLLQIARRLEAAGTIETAHRVINICGQVFRYGVATGRAARDPAGDLRGALQTTPIRHFASIKEPDKFGMLLRAIDSYTGGLVVRCAMKILALTFVRPGEMRTAEWGEIDLDKAEWRIPGEKMKMKRMHLVPLSTQAVEVFVLLKAETGHGRYVFPSARSRSGSRPMSDAAVVAALRAMGYGQDEMSAHGFRHTASTLLNESGLWSPDAIEAQMAHSETNKVRGTYNHAKYLPERRRMMQWWGEFLSKLLILDS